MSSSASATADGLLLPRGWQTPRIHRPPSGVVTTESADDALALGRHAGTTADPWQEFCLRLGLGETAAGRWAASIVVLIVSRQNGKNTILELRELAGLFIFDEQLIVHSAHLQRTSTEHFRRMETLIKSQPELHAKVEFKRGKGAEAIERVDTGQRIMFMTRANGSGRGPTADLLVFDEAMNLPDEFLADAAPMLAARSVVGDPQIWLTSSPVDKRAHEHGVVLSRVRAAGLAGQPGVALAEWSVDADSPDDVTREMAEDVEQHAVSNPGLGQRIAHEHVAKELPLYGLRKFAVERLGVGDWFDPEVDVERLIDLAKWTSLENEDAAPDSDRWTGIAFDVTPNRDRASIAVAGSAFNGAPLLYVHRTDNGTGWVVDAIVALRQQLGAGVPVWCDGVGPAASLTAKLLEHRVKVHQADSKELVAACGEFFDNVEQETMIHRGDETLTAAVAGAKRRSLGERWAWSRTKSDVDISPLVAATLALPASRAKRDNRDRPRIEVWT